MFNLGAASGLLCLQGKFDTQKGTNSLQQRQNSKATLSKINELTVGAYNSKNGQKAPLAGTEQATSAKEAEKKAAEGKATADDVADAKGAEGLKTVIDQETKDMIELEAMLDDEDVGSLMEYYGYSPDATIEPEKTWLDALKEGASSVADAAMGVVDDLKTNFCSAAPFPECANCPHRPELDDSQKALEIPDFLGMIGNAIAAIQAGLYDAALAVLGCPGMAGAIATGDVGALTGGIVAGATSSLLNTTLDYGAAGLTKVTGALFPEMTDAALNDGGFLKLTNSAGVSQYYSLTEVLIGGAVAADGLFTIGSQVCNGNFSGIPGLSSHRDLLDAQASVMSVSQTRMMRAAARRAAGVYRTQTGSLVAVGSSPAGILASTAGKALMSARRLQSTISVRRMRTRGGFSSVQMYGLPGSTMSLRSVRNAYGLDYIRSGRRTPRDVRCRSYSSICDALF